MREETKWMTIAEAARYIRMSIAFLRKCVRSQRVPYTRIGTKTLRFDRQALDEWLAASGRGGEANYGEKGR